MKEKYSYQSGKCIIWKGLIKVFFKSFFLFESNMTALLKPSHKNSSILDVLLKEPTFFVQIRQ